MSLESPLTRWWNAIRPLPVTEVLSEAELAQRKKQKRLIWSTVGVLAVAGCGWYVYDYIASAPQRARASLERGMRQMGPGTYKDAAAAFTRAIDIWPEYADAYLYRGIAEHNLGQTEDALADLDKATDLDATLTSAFAERGRIYQEKGNTAKAIDEFTKSLRIHPSTEGYYERALAYEALGDHQKAVADFDNAIVELRDAPYAYRARAMAKAALGDEEGAKADRAIADQIESR